MGQFYRFKAITSIVLLFLFVIFCSLAIIIFFAAGWLHTYKVFTQESPVAKVELSALKEDDKGQYFEVTITEVAGESPLTAMFSPNEENTVLARGERKTYKLYGDQFDIGGPTVKFHDYLTFLNFETVYKIAYVRAEYSNPSIEEQRTSNMDRRFDLNGGYSTWRSIQEDIQNNTFRGSVLKIFIDTIPQLNSRGVFVTDKEQTLTLCVTEEGFLFCNKEI
ncbi:hypothetical protein KC669_00885 [Candidatus Dojkabacteria bacterium]|uniref:Uncharacterized protein n=1 Tax=Candidatus Dojkabacteria bacterium TaxID=2099670 RepID=A0A955LA09_9BACT|nr:hypothetical protein [Candidatus Dojkabacteria bacterium]